jgi:ADP-heptose:LPS heptosyltransferase/glycosyltransferase involved in cell wall biosynthesis/SAM-dependent methyltransferase
MTRRQQCPICDCSEVNSPRPDLQPHPYLECRQCGLYYQQNLIPKVYEGFHEPHGATMPPDERAANHWLAGALNGWFDPAEVDKTALDIGSQYPWLSHCLGKLGWHCYAMDDMPGILQFTRAEKLKVQAFQCDFEPHAQSAQPWPWQRTDGTISDAAPLRFNLITLVHVIGRFYQPLPTLKAMFDLLKPGGTLFIRCPDSGVDGIERDFTAGHYDIHPQIWCQRALELAAMKTGFSIKETYTLYGQRDMALLKPPLVTLAEPAKPGASVAERDPYLARVEKQYQGQPRLELGVGMIVKNEQDDLPGCLDSLAEMADLICIVDTGSTDRTMAVIAQWADAHRWQACLDGSLPATLQARTVLVRSYTGASELENGDWKLWNFGQARNQYVHTLNHLVNWILWMDADDVLLQPQQVRPLLGLGYDVFGFGIVDAPENHSTRFIHHRLWRTGLGIEYFGACHEYPGWPKTARMHNTDLNIQHRWTVSPNQEAGPSRNLRILQREYQNGVRTPRVLFYLGNTLKDAGQYAAAIDVYAEYLALPVGYWDESIFCALYKMRCERQIAYQNGDYAAFFSTGFTTLAREQRFSEVSMELAYAYFDLGQWQKSIALCHFSLQAMPVCDLFLESNKYTDQPHRILARCYQQLGDWARAVYHTGQVLQYIPDDADMQAQARAWSANLPGQAHVGANTGANTGASESIQLLHVNRPGAAGDIIMSLMALEQYKAQHPHSHIVYYCAPQFASVARLSGVVDEVRDSSAFHANLPGRAVNFIGYPRAEGYPNVPMRQHLIEYFAKELGFEWPQLAAAGQHGVAAACCGFTPHFAAVGNPVLASALALDKKLITLHAKAGWSPYKNWSLANWQALLEQLAGLPGLAQYQFVQLGAADDPALSGVLDLRGQLSIVESVQLIKAARLHLGVDSFTNHATALLPPTPAIIVWGSTSPVGSGYAHNINLWKQEFACSPCYREYDSMSVDPKGKCPHDPGQSWEAPQHPCMQAIGVGEVLAAVLRQLGLA